MSDLDACPHCGQAGFARVKRWPWEKEGEPGLVWGYHVICDASGIDTHPRGCGASSGWGETPEEAIAAWNRRAYLAASGEVAPQPTQVAVKPLEWRSIGDQWQADTPIGWYSVRPDEADGFSHSLFLSTSHIRAFKGAALAKAAAQADYETRIRSALAPSPAGAPAVDWHRALLRLLKHTITLMQESDSWDARTMQRVAENIGGLIDQALAQPSAPEGWVMVPVEPDRATLERLASMWGYTLEETADSYGAFLEATAARPLPPAPTAEEV